MAKAVATRLDLMGLAPLRFGVEVVSTLPEDDLFDGRLVKMQGTGAVYFYGNGVWTAFGASGVVGAHTHEIADINGLQSALNGKASTSVATTSVNGLMSSTDKAKLDGIISGAQVTTVFGRTGAISAESGDYTAALISFDPATTSLAAITVQAALAELDLSLANHSHSDATTSVSGFMSAADKTKLNGLTNYTHPTGDGNRHVPATTGTDVLKFLKAGATEGSAPTWQDVTKADVGLSNVDNTSDANKPISTATQNALDAKLNSSAYTAADVLSKILTVDGPDSGLNADLLDGQHASAFSLVGHNHVAANITDLTASIDNRIIAYFDTEAATDEDLDTLRELIDQIKNNRDDIAGFVGIRKYTQNIGDGVATVFNIAHNFATLDVLVTVFEVATGSDVIVDVTRTSTNAVQIEFGVAPTTNEYRVVVAA